jgi:catechol 2,3-dioxygenase-like lactoylglutathione lyase family enzyme
MKALSAAALCLLISPSVWAQGAAPAATAPPGAFKGATVGFMHAIHATNNLDTTAAFYKEVFGASSPIRPFASQMPQVLTDSPGANLRVSMLPLPGAGFNFELTEFTNVEPRTVGQQPALSDPGAPYMKFLVRDIAPVVAGVKKMGHPIITRSGAPVAIKTAMGDAKAIFFRDPDGYIVEAIQVTPPADAAPGNIVGAIMGVTVRDMDADMKFWRDRMGLEPTGDRAFSTDAAMLDLFGIAKGGSFRTMTAVIPGSKARIEFIEFKGMPRKEFSIRVTDPGASGMAIRVQKIQELLPQLKAEGIRVLSRNGELVEWSDTIRNVFVKDPNGLNLELVGTAAGVPAGPPPATQAAPAPAPR